MNYAATLFQDGFRACGARLVPLTLGHALLMSRISSPYSFEKASGVTVNRSDVVTAAYVCSRHWSKAALGIQTGRCKWFLRLRAFASSGRQLRDLVTLREYFAAAWPNVGYWVKSKGGESGVGLLQSLVNSQRKDFNLSLQQALDVPMGVAVLDRYAMAESCGAIKLFTETDTLLMGGHRG